MNENLGAPLAERIGPLLQKIPHSGDCRTQLVARVEDSFSRFYGYSTHHYGYVKQRESWDCGVAAMAMVSGLLYEDVLGTLAPKQLEYAKENKGIPTSWVANILGELGCRTLKTFCREGQDWSTTPFGLRMVDVSGHFIVVTPGHNAKEPCWGHGIVFDPAIQPGLSVRDYKQAFDVWEVSPPCTCDRENRIAKGIARAIEMAAFDIPAPPPNECVEAALRALAEPQ